MDLSPSLVQPAPMKRGTVAHLAIQCRPSPNARPATFLYVGEKTEHGYTLASPAASDCVALFDWCDRNAWQSMPYNPKHPCGSYRKL